MTSRHQLLWEPHPLCTGRRALLSTPRKTHMLMSHCKVTDNQKTLIDTLEKCNLRTTQQMRVLEVMVGGLGELGLIKTDVQDSGRDKKEEKKRSRWQLFYGHFNQMKEMNSDFTFTIENDSENQIKHVFWANHNFQQLYKEFGDVVTFDMTYKTNRYGLIFGAFIGTNHHHQSILFGCGLISNEKFDLFGFSINGSKQYLEGHQKPS